MTTRWGFRAFVLLTFSGCSFGFSSQSPQSHFAFPNSNVIPLHEAEGSTSKLCGILIVTWGSPDADDQELATQRALAQGGGDLLINVRTDAKIFMVPYLFAICSTHVRGTAAKMEIGRQQLMPMNAPAMGPAPPAYGPPAYNNPPAYQPAYGSPPPYGNPPPAYGPPPAQPDCMSNADCKPPRVCRQGQCVNP